MNILIGIIRTVVWIWPFISEMFFAGKSFKILLKENWGKAIVTVFLLFSMFLNYVAFVKIYKITSGNTNVTIVDKKPKEPDAKPHQDDIEDIKKQLRDIYNTGEGND